MRVYREAGAGAVYAPALVRPQDIARIVAGTQAPVNVLALHGGPSMPCWRTSGRRVSTGGALAWVAYGALVEAARELQASGTSSYLDRALSGAQRNAVFGD